MDVRFGLWRKLSSEELMLLNCGAGEDSWESLGLQGNPTSPFWRRPVLGFNWKDWCQGWNSNTLATSCKELTHWKRPWCWEGLGAGGEGDDRGWDGWMASPTHCTWVWVNSGSWWWTGRPGVLQFIGSQRVGHDWASELNWWGLNKLVYVKHLEQCLLPSKYHVCWFIITCNICIITVVMLLLPSFGDMLKTWSRELWESKWMIAKCSQSSKYY